LRCTIAARLGRKILLDVALVLFEWRGEEWKK
jgi:hypothetical protein